MYEHCSDGSSCRASIARFAAYSKLSDRKVQYLLRDLCSRGILTQLAPGNAAKRRPAIYRINESVMEEDPRWEFSVDSQGRRTAAYRTRQPSLPGITRPWDPQIPDQAPPPPPGAQRAPVHAVQGTGAQNAPHLVHAVQGTGAQRAPDSKAFDSRSDSKTLEIHHGDAALNAMPAWLAFKEQLRAELSVEEWNLWVRPMFLLKALPAGENQKHLLAALPPSGRIQSAAIERLQLMREILAPAGLNISLTRYPDEWEISQAKERFGLDVAPRPWARSAAADSGATK